MEISRRALLQIGAAALPLAACTRGANAPAGAAADGDEWARLRAEFDFEEGVINLDNGWSAVPPRAISARFDELMRDVRRLPAYHLAHLTEVHGLEVYTAVADLLGVPITEIALQRNSTEGLGTVLLGSPLADGDEIVCAQTDYWQMLRMLDARAAAGAVLRLVELPVPAPDPAAIVDAYAAAINDRTRIVLLTHVSNVTGQIIPVREIAAVAHQHGALVVVDAAQSLAVLDHRVPELDCDYYASSLHKWLMAPLTSGVLWMRPELATALPSRLDAGAGTPGMEKFSEAGQAVLPSFIAIPDAIAFHQRIGPARKEARLRELGAHLRTRLASIPGARFFTVDEPWAGCALLVLDVGDRDPAALSKTLWERHRVLVQPVSPERAPGLRGVRFSPSLHTSVDELDRAAEAVAEVLA